MRLSFILTTAGILMSCVTAFAQKTDTTWEQVDGLFGRRATISGDVHRYGFPRNDLSVTLDEVVIKPALTLGGWIAFQPMHGEVAIMGDLVLLEPEINPVITKLIAGGLEITAIHNHLLRTTPATFYMHVSGHGDPVQIATTIHAALTASKTPVISVPTAGSPVPTLDMDTAQIEQLIGYKGQANGGVYQFAIPRGEPIVENGMPLSPPGPLGVATAINFQPTGNGKAAITGDFVLTGTEVNPVIRALRASSIEVTAVHSHMLDEQPRLFFLHFWANDDAVKLAKGIRSALEQTSSVKR
ncbi:MAG: DUF1259 domain-containing protein [Rhizobiales bacterium]|nr:DUF1259 domain-containing protein [Hyphomicrobiales bacterium]OJY45826.1 MAG: peptidase M23 [Rhizobiales bacterium 64-17]